MPIAATQPALSSSLESINNLGVAGTPSSISIMITTAIAGICPSGLFPVGISFIPLPPAGFSACQSTMSSAFNMGAAGTPSTTAQIMASAIATLCPIVPPTGLTLLQTMIENASNMGVAGSPSTTAQIIATAVINYYMAGLVI